MRRRTFLTNSAVAGLAVCVNGAAAKSGDIPKRVFGKTGERLTIIGQAGGRFPLCTFDDAKAVTLRAYELGINYFDTARFCRPSASISFSPPSLRCVRAREPKPTWRNP